METRPEDYAGNIEEVDDTTGREIVVPPARCLDLLRENLLLTVTYWLLFWSFGMGVSFLGPTLLDLGCQTGTVFSAMSWVFFAQSLFILVGSACGGFLIERFSKHFLLLLSCLLFAVMMAVIPFCHSLFPLALVLSLMGFCMGIIDTAANISMIELYGKRVGPFLQTLHFFYGLGAFLSPLIAEPFLLNVDCTPFIDPNSTKVASRSLKRLSAPKIRTATSLAHAVASSKVKDAFWIISGIQIPVVFLMYVVIARDRREEKEAIRKREIYEIRGTNLEKSEERKPVEEDTSLSGKQILAFAGIACLILFLQDGLQAIFNDYVYSFAIKSVKAMQATNAAYIDALFWGTFALGRLLSIGLSTKISPSRMLAGNLIGCLFGVFILMAFYGSQASLFCGVTVIGLFLSSVYPTIMSFVENSFDMKPSVTTSLVLSAASGEMILPVIVGYEFESSGAFAFLTVSLILAVCSLVGFGVLYGLSLSLRSYSASFLVRPLPAALCGAISRSKSPVDETKHLVDYHRFS